MGYRVKTHLNDGRCFEGRYKGYDISVYSMEETARPGRAWYIHVRDDDREFGTGYNGYWGNADHTLDEAVEQALIGSGLIDESQRKGAR